MPCRVIKITVERLSENIITTSMVQIGIAAYFRLPAAKIKPPPAYASGGHRDRRRIMGAASRYRDPTYAGRSLGVNLRPR
jgi:hypothetical protein